MSTFVKLASAVWCFLWCMMHVNYKPWYISYEPWQLRCIPHSIQPLSSVIGSLPLINPSPLAQGLSVVNFLWSRTRVVYMRNSHDLYITYMCRASLHYKTWRLILVCSPSYSLYLMTYILKSRKNFPVFVNFTLRLE